ncbi:MAG: GNAT family N-acetyltransferase [Pikeienuella sp.]
MGRVSFSVGLDPEHEAAAVELYLSAFADQLSPMLRFDDRSRDFLASCFRPKHCLCTLLDGELVAIAGFHDDDGGFIGFSIRDLIRSFGLFGGLWRAIGFLGAASEYADDEYLVDGFVVSPALRRSGIGRAVVRVLMDMAAQAGRRYLVVDVRAENSAARAFYTGCGFSETSESEWKNNRKVRMIHDVVTPD